MTAKSRLALVSVFVLALLAAATIAWDGYRSRDLPSREAVWIWAPEGEAGMPLAFVVAADFVIDEKPSSAEVRLTVDPEYELYVNGAWVGAGRWELERPLDVWEVGELLRPGPNRLAIVARSPYGVGGLLCALVADPDTERARTLASSGRSWSLYPRRPAGILEGWAALAAEHAEPETPRVWGRPPIGRWGRPRLGPRRPLDPAEGSGVWGRQVSPVPDPSGEQPAWLVDFGEVAVGWIDVWGGPTPDTRSAWRAAESLEELADSARSGWIVPLRGDERWRSPAPRRLRYLWIAAPQPPRSARITPSAPTIPLESPAEDERRAHDGLWHLEPSGAEPR